MREIPPLHVLCLRMVGSSSCSAEVTFAKDENGKPSAASRLLRAFHQRPIASLLTQHHDEDNPTFDKPPAVTSTSKNSENNSSLASIPMRRTPCIGTGSARRAQANEVDLHHPFCGQKVGNNNSNGGSTLTLVMEHGNPALDCLQSYVDALVELGRMDDSRLGLHFFDEWKINCLLACTGSSELPTTTIASSKKRRRGASSPAPNLTPLSNTPTILGSISLHNCSFASETMDAIVESQMGQFLSVLDLSGVNGLNDEMLGRFLPQCTQLQRLSLKNCRRVTAQGLQGLVNNSNSNKNMLLTSLDLGGVYNVLVDELLDVLPQLTHLQELHASGLGWTDATVQQLTTEIRSDWKALSLSYTQQLSQSGLRQALVATADTLQCLSLAFCENVVDNALLGMMGRNLPHVTHLDLRGNPNLTTLTSWYDGRASADLASAEQPDEEKDDNDNDEPQDEERKANTAPPLTVLGRYSGLSEASVEDTKRCHPVESADLVVILDGTGTGLGILSVVGSS